jgi:hypothetical protein
MTKSLEDTELARRAFLAKCGKYALITPPVVTLMLSASGKNNYALALSGSNVGAGGGLGAGASAGSGSGGSSGGGGGGPNDPGILQTRGGSSGTEFGGGSDIVCRTSRATPTRWRETACTRPGSPNFELQG